ncbi:hypothetical protein [Bordetella sp. H567]|uniref:hypothetical protein n=1 Tax=Bordetella sp. H567 TaxID=1697043 RepID=UPI0011AB7242|nr:hypothetical protein [Bordetella sp. H567]
MSDDEVAGLRQRLIDDAEHAWDSWPYAEQAFAVQELMRIDASQLRRAINGEIAAGRDAYGPAGALDPNFELHGPELPRRLSTLGAAAKHYRQYQGPSPLKTCAVVSDLQRQMAEGTEAR